MLDSREKRGKLFSPNQATIDFTAELSVNAM